MANVPTTSWSETSPAGSDSINAGDNAIRLLKTQIREVINVDHDFPSSGQAADVGQHLRVTLQEQSDLGTGAVGTTILGSQTVSGKGELVYTDEDNNDVQITTGGKINTAALKSAAVADIANLMALIYPIGYVITLGVNTNPATLLGIGTWTAIAGRVIVGIDGTQTEFDTLNETGGSKSVTLTSAQSGLPAHLHTVGWASSGGSSGVNILGDPDANNSNQSTQNTSSNSAANAAEAHTNLQPYIVKYVWERTA